jgi:hypothetical protein
MVANVRDGITTYLRNIRGIVFDVTKKVVSIAAGKRMGHLYEALTALGFGIAGNRHSSGGIGGEALQSDC